MNPRTELYWHYLKDNLEHARHHEVLRATTTNSLLVVAGVGFSVVTYDKCISSADIPLLLFIAIAGLFGAAFTAKQAERAFFHYQRANELRAELDKCDSSLNFERLFASADEKHSQRFPRLATKDVRLFWSALHLLVSLLAAILLVTIYVAPACAK